jgi:hypothetical protein
METTMTVVARQFALMTEAGYENYAASCITSFGLYSEILETWKHFPELEQKIRKNLKEATGREFNIPKHIAHASDIIYKMRDDIAAKGKYRLINRHIGKPLRVVEHIGCHYSKMFPHKGVGGAEYPYVLAGMIESWGGELVDYPERRHCCGFGFRQYLVKANRGYSIAKTHKKPRRSEIVYAGELPEAVTEQTIEDYPVTLFLTREGYFKKITPASLRMNDQQKCKDGDAVAQVIETGNACDLLFFTNKCQVYKSGASEFEDTKASVLGDFVAAKLEMDEGESVAYMAVTRDYSGYMLFAFDNGKIAKVELSAYATKTNRKKLIRAYSDKSPLAAALQIEADSDCVLGSSSGRVLLFHSGAIAPKTTKDTQGVAVMTLRKGSRVAELRPYAEGELKTPARYRTKNLPAAGVMVTPEEKGQVQIGIEV